MGYDWEPFRAEMHQMYIGERQTCDAVVQHFGTKYNFAPSKRAFQQQFKRWGFETKQHPAHRNDALVARVKELWESNVYQKDMLTILRSEGFEVNDRELNRLRIHHRWLLRIPNGCTLVDAVVREEDRSKVALNPTPGTERALRVAPALPDVELAPEVLAQRQARVVEIRADSDRRYAEGKRRRRTKSWGGMPADPPAPPRFPSEITIGESKTVLELTSDLYRHVTDTLYTMCREQGVAKKTVCGAQRWAAIKQELVDQIPHLTAQLDPTADRLEEKQMGLDVICQNVAKRIRIGETRITLSRAKTLLGFDPELSRLLRADFYRILATDHFTTKLEAGPDHWAELQKCWTSRNPELNSIINASPEAIAADPEHAQKVKSIEVLGRDVLKRLRDDSKRATKKLGSPASSSQTPNLDDTTNNEDAPFDEDDDGNANSDDGGPPAKRTRTSYRQGPSHSSNPMAKAVFNPTSVTSNHHTQAQAAQLAADPQIDPVLVLAANQSMNFPSMSAPLRPSNLTVPAYFRLAPGSPVQQPPRTWLSTIHSRPQVAHDGSMVNLFSVEDIKAAAVLRHANVHLVSLHGTMPTSNDPVPIDDDEELEAYLECVRGTKILFLVGLDRAVF
ncbi:MAG: hypothetical protein M1814_003796 [Vezdaea aestivalis]|nr:MAG: hypothetical protein M1814_003796 [Vezdaea aestivalis]